MDSVGTSSNSSSSSRSSSSFDSDEEIRFSEYILSSTGKAALEAENCNIIKIYDAICRDKIRNLSKKLNKIKINMNNDIQSKYVDLETGDKVIKYSKQDEFNDGDDSNSIFSDLSSSDSDVEVILAPMFPEWLKWTKLSKFSKEYFKINIPSSMNEVLDYYGIYTLEVPSTFFGSIIRTTIQGIYISATGITNSIVSLTKWLSFLVVQRRNNGELKL